MAYEAQPHSHQQAPAEPNSGLAGYAAIKYTAITIITLAIIGFLAWVVIHFTGS
ncbi:MAG: hypothetical protein ABR600_01980 [Actinomycetota bacterium]